VNLALNFVGDEELDDEQEEEDGTISSLFRKLGTLFSLAAWS
jgi:hypothetical protein